MSVVDKIAPFKDLRVKNNIQDWFDDEVAETIKLREKCLFQINKLHIDEELYKEFKYYAMKLIKKRKRYFIKKNLKKTLANQRNYGKL